MHPAHCKRVINRDVRPNNLMHTQSQVFLVDWGSATLQQNPPYEDTIHYDCLTRNLDSVKVGPADDLEIACGQHVLSQSSRCAQPAADSRQAADTSHAVVDTDLDTATTVAAGFDSS
ncbi:hypothetical protein ABBQ32_013486 [Trebouxia sp. C0010 RCD-2024]